MLCTTEAPENPCVPGGGFRGHDCALELAPMGALARNSHGIPVRRVRCWEGDPRCDVDPDLNNHGCTFRVIVCVNNTDPRLTGCTPGSVDRFEVLRPKALSTSDLPGRAIASALEAAVGPADLQIPVYRGAGLLSAGGSKTRLNACTAPLAFRVPLEPLTNGFARGTQIIRVRAVSGSFTDTDTLHLECRPSTCGNGIVEKHEACDDGNRIDGDGCDRGCHLE